MKVLIIGGSGFIGGGTALRLRQEGEDVTIASRRPPARHTALSGLPFIRGDYVAGDFGVEELAGFDAVIHAAANDARQRKPDESEAEHLLRANIEGVPRFFRAARDAGVKRAVYVGSFYPQVVPDAIERSPYVRSRLLADQGARALAADDFSICSVNPPYIIGDIEHLDTGWLGAHARYATGGMPEVPLSAPPGGVNFMSVEALIDAIAGALRHGENGKAYLVGDENLTFQEYLNRYRKAAGLPQDIPLRDEEHPLLPDWSLYAGRGNAAFYMPDAGEAALLGYRRGDLDQAFADVVNARKPVAGA
ncbi:nucleoside-diphosphate sugar epimerase [Croceicoccus estronivorus]|uniref:NAD-dependent epimerase/dehydratase family protein n=1 Tax=Croceicoccus estronivorus TaxID=1172626 RepID=UPI00082C815F|nr:NAD-dependent epimerase/dehydratase family protein [Croceicoccus estronivorus]OCC23585.1 nucleoside-diphosphate sugar epimerase [Croceicoccus estronivorus]